MTALNTYCKQAPDGRTNNQRGEEICLETADYFDYVVVVSKQKIRMLSPHIHMLARIYKKRSREAARPAQMRSASPAAFGPH